MSLANYVAGLPPSVRTVAYVPNQAQGDAALIAVACDQLVMYPEAALGGQGQAEPQDDAVEQATRAVRELAETKGRSWSLMAALVDPTLAVYQYQNKNSGALRYFTETEAAEQEAPEQWEQGPVVVQQGELLEVDGQRAKEFGLAWEVVDSFGQLKQAYGLEGDLRTVEPGWLDFLVRALASPGMSMLLLFIGGAAVYAELQVPGIGIAGFIASVAFLLFFWAKFLHGTAGWLEVLLFLGGFCFLLLEIFVIPGFGVFGLGGGLMIIASIVLASQRFFIPQNDTEFLQLRESMIMLVGATVGIITAAFLFRRYLPHAPVFSRLLLSPPEGEDYVKLATRESMVDLRHLVGLRGTAQTQLTPAGKASLDGRLIDVIADGEVIDRGSTIEVVEVRGNRVLVRSMDAL
jgi:membrane-bound ClpP family serine protease